MDTPTKPPTEWAKYTIITTLSITTLITAYCYTQPKYHVWEQEQYGMAELARAEGNRKVVVLEAQAKLEAAKSLAEAEIARSRGVAEANKIIGDSLKGNESYLHYLWIHNLAESKGDIIYIPTEANLPILEAGRRPKTEK